LQLPGEQVPVYGFPESAARVLAKMATYADWRARPAGTFLDLGGIDPAAARDVCRTALQDGREWLTTDEVAAVLTALSLPLASSVVVTSAHDAVAAAEELGYPVALKVVSDQIIHKTDAGGVKLDLRDADAVARAYDAISSGLVEGGLPASSADKPATQSALVQSMVTGGVELMVGVTHDELFGPLIGFGLGGIHVEVLADVTFRMAPLTDRDAREMIREVRAFRLLEGYRGHPAADIAAVEDVLLRVSRLVEDVPEIVELDLNPVIALGPGQGCRIVDARIRVGDA
jgi:acyl-CoA synthetase (NDP forming)